MRFPHLFGTTLALFAMGAAASADGGRAVATGDGTFPLAEGGRPAATIVIASEPPPAARLGALELQASIRTISGAVLPIAREGAAVHGPRVLIGESAATREHGLRSADFGPQEYLVRIVGEDLVLLGRDWLDTPESRAVRGMSTNWMDLKDTRPRVPYGELTGTSDLGGDLERSDLELPGLFDDQGSLHAVYDVLEAVGVRWFGPSEVNIVHPNSPTVRVTIRATRRAPAFRHREGIAGATSVWPLNKGLWDDPSGPELQLYVRRMREGGDRWAANHSFVAYRDRFRTPEEAAKHPGWPLRPELFEADRPEYFAQGAGGGEGQFCYTNPAFIEQVAQDARDFFDGQGVKGTCPALGDFFAVVPLDNSQWCQCERCQSELTRSQEQYSPHFSNGRASRYLFDFVNAVAREVARTHPDRYIATLAYWDYAYYPKGVELEPNVSVAPCLQTRIYWAPNVRRNDIETFYRPWAREAARRPIYLWLYGCFPEENALGGGYRCFPGFMAHTLAENLTMYARGGIRGIFFCGYGEQVDYYVAMKLLDDPSRKVDDVLDDFFRLYYGAAAVPMKRLYLRIESIYSDAANYPPEVRTEERQFHQNESIAWQWLGTEERMAELGALMAEARRAARTDLERERVELFDKGVWQYMEAGRAAWLAKHPGA